ncbi:VOC family protein [Paraflavisolibacter sp. H34]|uniref:VOC family protein n=1 Tax=Huijunlia imazamoxiresistens TaxID=3127457 RepID=UPI00301A5342
MIHFKRLDHLLISIPPGATEAARQFYAGVLELEEIPGSHPRGAIWFTIADIELHVREEAGGNESSRHPAFEVADLEQAKAFLLSKKVPVTYSSEIDGRNRCFFRDPFGNRFELIEFHQR